MSNDQGITGTYSDQFRELYESRNQLQRDLAVLKRDVDATREDISQINDKLTWATRTTLLAFIALLLNFFAIAWNSPPGNDVIVESIQETSSQILPLDGSD